MKILTVIFVVFLISFLVLGCWAQWRASHPRSLREKRQEGLRAYASFTFSILMALGLWFWTLCLP